MADMRAYWPNPSEGRQLIVQEATTAYGPERLTVLKRYRNGGVINGHPVTQLDEYITTEGWLSAWEYRFHATHGVIEVANKYPGKHMVYKHGLWIVWGGNMEVGDNIAQAIEVDLSKGFGVGAGPHNYGWQSVTLEAMHPTFTNDGGLEFVDVAQIRVLQTWCKDAACAFPAGQNVYEMRYWLAPGVGIVQIDYIAPNARRDYARHIVETVAMDNAA